MTEARQVLGLFRDRGQARLAVAEALRMGLSMRTPHALVEDADGVHVALDTTGQPDDARVLLLERRVPSDNARARFNCMNRHQSWRPREQRARATCRGVICVVVVLACAACAVGRANTPATPVQIAPTTVPPTTPTSQPEPTTTPPEQTAASPTSALAAPPATPTGAMAADVAIAPTPVGATPDRPFGARTRDSGCSIHDRLPDRACTPGAIFPDVTAAQVCQRGYSATVRNVPAAVSREVYRAYGIVERTTGEYEVDHLVPLELGGSNDVANLWPESAEPRPGFHEKDQVENRLRSDLCAGRMSLFEAQRAIATNWLQLYQGLR